MKTSRSANDSPEMELECQACELPRCINCCELRNSYGWATRFWLIDKHGTLDDMDKFLKPIRRVICTQ